MCLRISLCFMLMMVVGAPAASLAQEDKESPSATSQLLDELEGALKSLQSAEEETREIPNKPPAVTPEPPAHPPELRKLEKPHADDASELQRQLGPNFEELVERAEQLQQSSQKVLAEKLRRLAQDLSGKSRGENTADDDETEESTAARLSEKERDEKIEHLGEAERFL